MTSTTPPTNRPRGPRPIRPPVLKRIKNRERRYPVWSTRALLLAGFIGAALAALTVALVGRGSVIARIEVTLGVVAGALFLTLAVGLYAGARVRKREDVAGQLQTVGTDALPDSFGDLGSGLDMGGGDDGCLGAVLGLVLIVFLAIAAVFLVLLAVNVGLVLFFLLAVVTGGIFHRAIRQVFAKSRKCRGDLAASLMYAGWYTFLYTGWLFAALTAVGWAMKRG